MTERSLINARYRYFCSALTLGLRRDHALQHPNSFQKVNRGGKSSDKSSKSSHPIPRFTLMTSTFPFSHFSRRSYPG